MIQAHFIYCALYFYYDYISPTCDHQALGPRGRGTPGLKEAASQPASTSSLLQPRNNRSDKGGDKVFPSTCLRRTKLLAEENKLQGHQAVLAPDLLIISG